MTDETESTWQKTVRNEVGELADQTRRIVHQDLETKRERALGKGDIDAAAEYSALSLTSDLVSDVDMADLGQCWVTSGDCDLWNGALDLAGAAGLDMHGVVQSYIRAWGGLPTDKEVEDERERRLTEDRKQWDQDLGSSGAFDEAMDELRRLRIERDKLKE